MEVKEYRKAQLKRTEKEILEWSKDFIKYMIKGVLLATIVVGVGKTIIYYFEPSIAIQMAMLVVGAIILTHGIMKFQEKKPTS